MVDFCVNVTNLAIYIENTQKHLCKGIFPKFVHVNYLNYSMSECGTCVSMRDLYLVNDEEKPQL